MNIGMSREEFIASYFEKQPLLKKQALCHHSVSWNDINDALFSWNPHDGLLHLYKDGLVPAESYTESFVDVGMPRVRIIKDIFYDHLRAGATLVLNRLDTKLPVIQRITLAIARFVGEKAVSNGYVAFGGQGTFAKHWDTHDVFAVQLIGRKQWRVFPPTFESPLVHQKSKEHKDECPEVPVLECILEAGDVLYIPRGWWHEAIPLEGEETLHIATGIHMVHVADYFVWACSQVLTEELSFRRALRFENGSTDEIRKAIDAIKDILIDPEHIRKFKKAQLEGERMQSAFEVEMFGQNSTSKMNGIDQISLNSSYRRNSSDGMIDAQLNGMSLKLDDMSAKFMQGIFDGDSVEVASALSHVEPERRETVIRLLADLLKCDVIANAFDSKRKLM